VRWLLPERTSATAVCGQKGGYWLPDVSFHVVFSFVAFVYVDGY
jgi:hypothetical protein